MPIQHGCSCCKRHLLTLIINFAVFVGPEPICDNQRNHNLIQLNSFRLLSILATTLQILVDREVHGLNIQPYNTYMNVEKQRRRLIEIQ